MTTVFRTDRSELRSPVKLPNGFMRVDGYLSRAGIFEYRQPDGKIRRELRPPEEVFKVDSLASFASVPITLDHPLPGLLTAQNAAQFAVGSVGEPKPDGDKVRASMLITDARAIAALERGKTQVSCGYTAEVEETAGVWNGERFDVIQRNIVANHVAIVDVGRAGPEVRVRMDDALAALSGRMTPETRRWFEESLKALQTAACPAQNGQDLWAPVIHENAKAILEGLVRVYELRPELMGSGRADDRTSIAEAFKAAAAMLEKPTARTPDGFYNWRADLRDAFSKIQVAALHLEEVRRGIGIGASFTVVDRREAGRALEILASRIAVPRADAASAPMTVRPAGHGFWNDFVRTRFDAADNQLARGGAPRDTSVRVHLQELRAFAAGAWGTTPSPIDRRDAAEAVAELHRRYGTES